SRCPLRCWTELEAHARDQRRQRRSPPTDTPAACLAASCPPSPRGRSPNRLMFRNTTLYTRSVAGADQRSARLQRSVFQLIHPVIQVAKDSHVGVTPITVRSGCEAARSRPPTTLAACGRPRVATS